MQKMDDEELKEVDQFEELIQGLIDNHYGCCDDFMLPNTLIGLQENIKILKELGRLKPSGFGNRTDYKNDQEIRGDKINWILTNSINPFELIYLNKIKKFINHLNKTCFTSINNFESHYSTYPKNSFYKRHIDQFKSEKGRKFSIVLYLNDNWKLEDGGMLSLHPEKLESVLISPIIGRMMFFKSDEMEHEVLASLTRERISIAGWMKN